MGYKRIPLFLALEQASVSVHECHLSSDLSEESHVPLRPVWEILLDFRVKHLYDIIYHLTTDLIEPTAGTAAARVFVRRLEDLKGSKPAQREREREVNTNNPNLGREEALFLTSGRWEQCGAPLSIFHGEDDRCSTHLVLHCCQRSQLTLPWLWECPERTSLHCRGTL